MGGGSSKPEAREVKMTLAEIKALNPFLQDSNQELFAMKRYKKTKKNRRNPHISTIILIFICTCIAAFLYLFVTSKKKK